MERKNATDALRFPTAPTHHRRWISNFVAELLLPSSDDAALFLLARSKERALSLSLSPLPHSYPFLLVPPLVRSRLSRLLTSFFFFFAPSAIRDQRCRKMFIRQPVSSSAENGPAINVADGRRSLLSYRSRFSEIKRGISLGFFFPTDECFMRCIFLRLSRKPRIARFPWKENFLSSDTSNCFWTTIFGRIDWRVLDTQNIFGMKLARVRQRYL